MTTPKGGRLRYVPLTIRLAAAFRDHRHLRSPNVLCQDDGQPLTRQMVQCCVRRAERSCRRTPLTVQGFGDILETGRVSEEKING